jgi:tRNA-dihydrouridine synthase B
MTPNLPIAPDAPWLAPLAGFSDLPFRLLCREQGAAVACTEMVSAKGLVYGARQKKRAPGGSGGTEELLATCPEDAPLVVQLFGAEPEFLAEATRLLRERGFCWFDVNMGCSVPKVTKTGAGAALLRDPARALAAAAAVFRVAGPGKAGGKMRLGWDAASPVYLDLGKALEDAGAAWITLHPRWARQGFSGEADMRAWERLARAVRIPVLASGDLFGAREAARCLSTGVRGVMFARGAMRNPAIFAGYLALLRDFAQRRRGEAATGVDGSPAGVRSGQEGVFPDRDGLFGLILRHVALARKLTPDKPGRSGIPAALLKMRAVIPRYARHLPGAKGLRLELARCGNWEAFDICVRRFFSDARGAVNSMSDRRAGG